MRPFLLSLVAALALALPRPGRADVNTPTVVDDARLFGPETIAQAERQIDEIRRTYQRDLLIETVEALPRPRKWWLRFWARRQVNRALADLARERAQDAAVDGLCVLICKDPRGVSVVAWPEGHGQEITAEDCEQLRTQVVRDLQGDPDQALLNAVAKARNLFHHRLAAERAGSRDGVNIFLVAVIMLALLGVWLTLCLVRLRLNAGHRPALADQAPGLLGYMFGSMAGHWIYDRLFQAGPAPLAPAGPDLVAAWGRETPAAEGSSEVSVQGSSEGPNPPEVAENEGHPGV
jgi:hypothetical protein